MCVCGHNLEAVIDIASTDADLQNSLYAERVATFIASLVQLNSCAVTTGPPMQFAERIWPLWRECLGEDCVYLSCEFVM